MNKIEKQWDYFGEKNPYFAVSTYDKFHAENLDKDSLDEFFKSGTEHVDRIWGEIESSFGIEFNPKRSLDFGCGVGRLTIPIASKSGNEVVGVDISQKMLDEAERNSGLTKTEGIHWVKGDNDLSRVSGKFDFVHSFIVIQHIKPDIGEKIFERLINLLEDDGIGALHLTYKHPGKLSSVLRFRMYRRFPFIYALRNMILRKRKEPLIPIYTYDLANIFEILRRNNCHNTSIRFSEHGHHGMVIFFRKRPDYIY